MDPALNLRNGNYSNTRNYFRNKFCAWLLRLLVTLEMDQPFTKNRA